MPATHLADHAATYLRTLCQDLPGRAVGSAGNRAATRFFAETIASFGFDVTTPAFDCIDWASGGAALTADGVPFAVQPSPYSLGGQAQAPLVVASTLAELETGDASGKILLLRGELAKEPLMPKSFEFYNPDEHRQIVAQLERQQPLAIVGATARSPGLAGALYPCPLIEDGDFDIPSGYMTEEEGVRLAAYAGQTATLTIDAQRLPSTGCNVVATRDGGPSRVVLFAHIDAKAGTPGAIDNAAGVTVLLLVAELLADYAGPLGIEIVALNGEDYYANPGEMLYLRQNAGRFDEIVLGINIDGVGYQHGPTAFSLYDCPPDLAGQLRGVFDRRPGIVEGEPWYQGDHFLFLMHQRPALAMTSSSVMELLGEIVHTEKDTLAIVDPARLVEAAEGLAAVVRAMGLARQAPG
jgi:aminopeptidase YwaD